MITTTDTIVREAIRRIAPDIDPSELTPDADLRADLELDSMDFLNVMVAIHERTGVEVPESDYPRVATVGLLAAYVDARLPKEA